jgi:hypothetical protein
MTRRSSMVERSLEERDVAGSSPAARPHIGSCLKRLFRLSWPRQFWGANNGRSASASWATANDAANASGQPVRGQHVCPRNHDHRRTFSGRNDSRCQRHRSSAYGRMANDAIGKSDGCKTVARYPHRCVGFLRKTIWETARRSEGGYKSSRDEQARDALRHQRMAGHDNRPPNSQVPVVTIVRTPYFSIATPYSGAPQVVCWQDTWAGHISVNNRATAQNREFSIATLTSPTAVLPAGGNAGYVMFISEEHKSPGHGAPFGVVVDPYGNPLPAVASIGHRRELINNLDLSKALWLPPSQR